MAPGKGVKQRTDWKALKKRFLAHEWVTLEQMGEALNIPKGTYYKRTGGWILERRDIEKEADANVHELIIQDRVAETRSMFQRQLEMSRALQIKAANKLLKKHFDIKTGKWEESEFANEGIALAALRLGVSMEQSLLLRKQPGENEEPNPAGMIFNGPNFVLNGGGGGNNIPLFRELSPKELQAIIDAPDDHEPGNKKSSS